MEKECRDIVENFINKYNGIFNNLDLYDLKTFSPKDLTSTKIVVKTGSNTIGMKQIVDYLEKDVYPILPYEIIVIPTLFQFICRIIVS